MTKQEVIRELCRIVALVYRSIDDYTNPSDGFCDLCPFHDNPQCFKHSGKTIDYVRQAVVEKLKRDGVRIAQGFNPETGRESNPGDLS